MAYTAGKIKLQIEYEDVSTSRRTKTLELNPAHTDCTNLATIGSAAGKTNLDAIAAKFAAVTLCKLIKYTVSQEFVSDSAATPAGDADDKAVVSVALAEGGGKRGNIYIPAPVNTIFINEGAYGEDAETIDPADAGLLEFLALYVDTQVDDDTDPEGTLLLSDGEEASDTLSPKGRKV